MAERKLKPWKLIESRRGPEVPLFNINIERYRNPRNGQDLDAIVLHASPTVNVICITVDRKVILVEQFRFGSGQFHLELPAGMIDPGESSLESAQRELQEETGFVSDHWTELGTSFINPAYVDNTCRHFLVQHAREGRKLPMDRTEDLAVHQVDLADMRRLLQDGTICDGMSRAACCLLSTRGPDWSDL